jgi:hypothetical protein
VRVMPKFVSDKKWAKVWTGVHRTDSVCYEDDNLSSDFIQRRRVSAAELCQYSYGTASLI